MPGESSKKRSLSGPAISSPSPSPQKKVKGDDVDEEGVAPVPVVVSVAQEGKAVVRMEMGGASAPIVDFVVQEGKAVVRMEMGVAQAPTNEKKLYFAKLSDQAEVPSKGSKGSAGYDLKSAYKYIVPARGSELIKTDIQVKLPPGYYGRVAPRYGLALHSKIGVGAGVIDEDYRGNVGVILFNHGDLEFDVNKGDRVAQLICEKICYPELVELKTLDETERGEGGFGSTGVADEEKKTA